METLYRSLITKRLPAWLCPPADSSSALIVDNGDCKHRVLGAAIEITGKKTALDNAALRRRMYLPPASQYYITILPHCPNCRIAELTTYLSSDE